MKILTWNVNGIRASKVPLKALLDSLDCDVICFQETKVTRDQLDEASCIVEGYNAYFSFSKKRSGYSGVATFCRNTAAPVAAEEGLTGLLAPSSSNASTIGFHGNMANFTEEELHALDAEGRAVMTQHKLRSGDGKLVDVVIINVYCPRADRENQERFNYKLQFYELLQLRAESLVKAGRYVIVVGDINASHKPIDHCDPDVEKIFKLHPSRKWLDRFLNHPDKEPEDIQASSPKQSSANNGDAKGTTADHPVPSPSHFVDTFRFFYPDRKNAFTCWSTVTSARQTNYGTRIDYIFADKDLCRNEFINCDIMPEVEGSDHCPVKAELKGMCEASSSYPALCTKFMPEFAGKQQKLSSFFQKVSPSKRFSALMSTEEKSGGRTSESVKMGVGKKRGNPVDASTANRNKKKQKPGPAAGSLLHFFQRKDSSCVPAPCKPPQRTTSAEDNQNSAVSISTDNVVGKIAEKEQATQINVVENKLETPPSSSQESTSSEKSDKEATSNEKSNKEASSSEKSDKGKLSAGWKTLFKGLPPPPLCKGHKEPCVLRTVKKSGPNRGKRFYVCSKPEGHKSNPEARCDHFEWMGKK